MAFSVFVGGWRHVGTFETYEEAQGKKNTCISLVVDIVETDLKVDSQYPEIVKKVRGFSDEELDEIFGSGD